LQSARSEDNIFFSLGTNPGEGEGVFQIMAYLGRLCLTGVPFTGFRKIKGWGFHKSR